MKQLEECKLPVRQAIIVILAGSGLSLAIFLVSKTIFAGNTWNLHLLFAFYAVLAGVLSGLLIFANRRLKHFMRLLEIFKAQASMDKLTELYNRSYLEPFLENEIESADRLNNQISMIMVDMDRFKDINDTYGHTVGDRILTIFAQVVLKCIRKTDVIVRYGGDEFVVVLPRTDTETAHIVAERIREEVSATYIPPIDGAVISSISCSVGVSTYPALCSSKSSLIKTSDLALYEAKHAGRNRTIVYKGSFA